MKDVGYRRQLREKERELIGRHAEELEKSGAFRRWWLRRKLRREIRPSRHTLWMRS